MKRLARIALNIACLLVGAASVGILCTPDWETDLGIHEHLIVSHRGKDISITEYPAHSIWDGSLGFIAFVCLIVLAVFAGPLDAMLSWQHRRRLRKFRRLCRCHQCGYDLRESPDRCPECGTQVPPPTRADARPPTF